MNTSVVEESHNSAAVSQQRRMLWEKEQEILKLRTEVDHLKVQVRGHTYQQRDEIQRRPFEVIDQPRYERKEPPNYLREKENRKPTATMMRPNDSFKSMFGSVQSPPRLPQAYLDNRNEKR